ncbi:hypothetical protein [Prosthecochloris sp.]|uniref:hypothetical protein n=1 Tax=Prosthecochloris sp. TaxID=290513 RepID=UPI002580F886|nr:hypothetical protein [Prosthecochloris sp.]
MSPHNQMPIFAHNVLTGLIASGAAVSTTIGGWVVGALELVPGYISNAVTITAAIAGIYVSIRTGMMLRQREKTLAADERLKNAEAHRVEIENLSKTMTIEIEPENNNG